MDLENSDLNKQKPWRWNNIDWKFVFSQQHYGSLVFTLGPCIALGLVLWAFGEEPELDMDPAFVVENQDYNNPKKSGKIPAVVAVAVPLVMFLLSVFVGEIFVFRKNHLSISNAVYTWFYFLISWFNAFAVHIFAQQISAIVVSEPRPDFGSRCKLENGECTGNIDDGLSSFFSGHASSAILSATYSSIYILWLIYFRKSSDGESSTSTQKAKTWADRLADEFLHAFVLYLIVLQMAFAWIVGVSRITDHRHHIWDVNCGFLVGIVVGAIFCIHSIAVLSRMPKHS